MSIHPELGTFDFVAPGSNLSNLNLENAQLRNANTALYIALSIAIVGIAIYIANERQKRAKYDTEST